MNSILKKLTTINELILVGLGSYSKIQILTLQDMCILFRLSLARAVHLFLDWEDDEAQSFARHHLLDVCSISVSVPFVSVRNIVYIKLYI